MPHLNLKLICLSLFLYSCAPEHDKIETNPQFNANMKETPDDSLIKYSHKIIVYYKDGGVGNGTCFFVNHEDSFLLVTAAHILYQENKLMEIDKVEIFPNLLSNPPIGLQIPADKIKATQVFLNGGFADAAVIRIPSSTASQMNYNTFNINQSISTVDPAKGSEMFIVGYPNQELKIIRTTLYDWRGSNFDFDLNDIGLPGSSGAPVVSLSNSNQVTLVGINGGRTFENKGGATKAGVLAAFIKTSLLKNR